MIVRRISIVSVLFLLGACGGAVDDVATADDVSIEAPLHPHPQKGNGAGGGVPLGAMTLHGGSVIHASKTMAIFWGANWNNASFAGDKISGLDTFFSGFGGSRHASLLTEYYDATGSITSASTYLGHTIDAASNPPNKALSTSQAVNEGCKVSGQNPDPNALYLIYTQSTAGHVGYCAWHSYGTCSNGKPIQVAYMPNIDGIAGCNPGDTSTGHSEGLAALANVTAHELTETITDPRNGGWYASTGSGEIGDKCAWTFKTNVTLANGSTWKIQEEWSNNAFNAGTGDVSYETSERGCVQGN